MDKETLSNYGWIVICVLVLAVMIALASPFGNFIADAVKSTAQGLFDVNQGALDAAGITIDDNGFADGGTETPTKDPALNPDDGTTPQDGDTYEYGDYIYTYKATADATYHVGWQVNINTAVTDTKQTSYGAILESINGEPVTNMNQTFFFYSKLTTAPEIPNSVTNMRYTFQQCTKLTTAPVIPSSVTSMSGTFAQCTSLTTAPAIPSNVTILASTFQGCTSLKTYAGSTDPEGDFSNYVIPSSVTDMNGTFRDCTSLTVAPKIPNSVTSIGSAFWGCTSLVTAPVIPESVGIIQYAFRDCTSLTGTITINGAIRATYYDSCFANVDFEAQNITLEGTTTFLNAIGKSGKNYCATCHGKCQNNH